MTALSSLRKPVQQSLSESYTRNRRVFLVLRDVLMWLAFYFLFIRSVAPRLFEDSVQVTNTASVALFLQTILLHYFIGYYLFPKFLYQRNYVKSCLLLLACFFATYQTNYLLFQYLNSISVGNANTGSINYVRKTFSMLQNAGWLGCFTNLRVILWNFSYNFFLPILTVFFKSFTDVMTYQRRLLIAERDKFALELDFLKAQVSPHFLFNTLNSVYSRIFDTDEQAADLILRLSELMRYNLYETDLPKIALDKELAYIQNYLALERNRLLGQHVIIDYEQSGEPEHYQIAPLLLITFVENAFKHGVKGGKQSVYVQVRADITENTLVFCVENSVLLRRSSPGQDKKSGGIGLDNVRKRLEALYPNQYKLILTPSQNLYQAKLTLQLESLR